MLGFVLVLVVIAVAVWVISAPFRRPGRGDLEVYDPVVAELEAEKEAKYREIRDSELDLRTGKLSGADHRTIDAGLRAEAIELLRRLDDARARSGREAAAAAAGGAPAAAGDSAVSGEAAAGSDR